MNYEQPKRLSDEQLRTLQAKCHAAGFSFVRADWHDHLRFLDLEVSVVGEHKLNGIRSRSIKVYVGDHWPWPEEKFQAAADQALKAFRWIAGA